MTLWLCACSWLSACNNDGFGPDLQSCTQDSDCHSGSACTRAGQCFPQDQIRSVAVVWTVNGQPAGTDSCGTHPSFTLQFDSDSGYGYGYAPVPCVAGKFSVDKIATIINFVEMFDDTGGGGAGPIIDATNQASLDLTFRQ